MQYFMTFILALTLVVNIANLVLIMKMYYK